MSYQSELQLENELISQLQKQGWERIVLENYAALENNFREQFNKFNGKALNGTPLSDDEFRTVLAQIEDQGVFTSAKLLRDNQLLTRDDGTVIHYSLFNTKEWCKNHFQVANQIKTSGSKWNTRYDVTLLINGLPVIQVELKRNGIEIGKAFNQIDRYKRDRAYSGLFNFIQFFIISNGIYTRYFANDEKELDEAYMFKWTDEKNNQYKSLSEFASHFLDKCWSAKMISRYMVLQETDKRIIIMRPYQVYGVERMTDAALNTGNNGFIWHTTGSGKTLTSFKVSQLLADDGKFKKVFFLVDRRDLNKQTAEEFNHFKKDSVVTNNNTHELVKNIESEHAQDRLILTTIQKFNKALTNPRYRKAMQKLKDEKVAFVIDECHRTQFGEMQRVIRSHYTNAQHFGFTGTPRFVENQSQDGKTTADIFGQCLHTYLLKDGIRDRNTLAFSVEYINTLIMKEEIENPEMEVKGLATEEVWDNPARIRMIVKDILADRKRKSHNRKYNAILTVDSVKAVGLYMKAFEEAQKELPKSDHHTIATVYSFDENSEVKAGQEHPKWAMDRYITEYNTKFGTNFNLPEISRYNSDVADRFKKNQIDLLIVVDMMLTGFDSRILNTLYVDRTFEHHSLIQAYSRTNRVHGKAKQVGHIRCYRNLKEKTDEAVKLFSNVSNADDVLALPYSKQKQIFTNAITTFKREYPQPEVLYSVESEQDKKAFVLAFRQLIRELRRIETFSEFCWEDFDMDEQTVKVFQTHYLEFRTEAQEGDKASILNDIDFQIELVLANTINVDYIYHLLTQLDVKDKKSVNELRDMVETEGTDKLRKKRDLLLDFIDTVIPGLNEESNIMEEYQAFLDKESQKEIANKSADFGISTEALLTIASIYRFQKKFDGKFYDKETNLTFPTRLDKRRELREFVSTLAERYETEA